MKRLMLILIPILLAGGVVAAGFFGIIKIPGLTPKKGADAALYAQGAERLYEQSRSKPEPVAARPKPVEKPKAAVAPAGPVIDPIKGSKKLAKLWNDVEPKKLVELTADWKEQEVAAVMLNMAPDQASLLLAELPPDRASRLSREVQRLASILPPAVKR